MTYMSFMPHDAVTNGTIFSQMTAPACLHATWCSHQWYNIFPNDSPSLPSCHMMQSPMVQYFPKWQPQLTFMPHDAVTNGTIFSQMTAPAYLHATWCSHQWYNIFPNDSPSLPSCHMMQSPMVQYFPKWQPQLTFMPHDAVTNGTIFSQMTAPACLHASWCCHQWYNIFPNDSPSLPSCHIMVSPMVQASTALLSISSSPALHLLSNKTMFCESTWSKISVNTKRPEQNSIQFFYLLNTLRPRVV